MSRSVSSSGSSRSHAGKMLAIAATATIAACRSVPPTTLAAVAPPRRIVFVLPAADTQILANGKRRSTGYFLNEFHHPYAALTAAGHQVVIATPGGQPAALDPEGLDEQYWPDAKTLAEARALVDTLTALQAPLSLEDILLTEPSFDGIIVPGGQGVMVDLLDDPNMHRLLAVFGRTGRAVGLICHAPAILARLPVATNPFLGRRVTSVSAIEEWYIERFVMQGRAQVRSIGRLLNGTGHRHESARPKANFAVRDGNLVTSQNPFSGSAFLREYAAALAASPHR